MSTHPKIHQPDESAPWPRRHSRQIHVGSVPVGGAAPVTVQSMTNTDTRDPKATVKQIQELANLGCQLIRVAVPDMKAAKCLAPIMQRISLPLIADIHFNADLALAALDAGVQGVRINPGNISSAKKLRTIALKAASSGAAVRIGVNGGSLEKSIRKQYDDRATPAALVESALRQCRQFEEWGCRNIKVSLKSSSPTGTVEACRRFAAASDHPLHLGLTEAGPPETGALKSAVVLGTLLMEGIGDTVRVSLTGNPRQEVIVAKRILAACGLHSGSPDIISCPTCGRTEIDLNSLVREVEEEVLRLEKLGGRIGLKTIAVMGCSVNGPGEAQDADLGIAGGKGKGAFFENGSIVCTLPEKELKAKLLEEIRAHTTFPEA